MRRTMGADTQIHVDRVWGIGMGIGIVRHQPQLSAARKLTNQVHGCVLNSLCWYVYVAYVSPFEYMWIDIAFDRLNAEVRTRN